MSLHTYSPSLSLTQPTNPSFVNTLPRRVLKDFQWVPNVHRFSSLNLARIFASFPSETWIYPKGTLLQSHDIHSSSYSLMPVAGGLNGSSEDLNWNLFRRDCKQTKTMHIYGTMLWIWIPSHLPSHRHDGYSASEKELGRPLIII